MKISSQLQQAVMRQAAVAKPLTVPGVGTILVNVSNWTLEPKTPTIGQKIGVGYQADNAALLSKQRRLRNQIEDLAEDKFGPAPYGWDWKESH